ncbi:GNAT family N-acetyltransferase [Lactiplantibacillus garii]|uniref:GNAT family N-acetyltransferase n=1 Tax=Lactiplantibacillus garii TaxID=2306423 RepID=A0A426D7T9_9LACO|nr:GNAT family N-acetyltransferase [Lactiplantibacillus garii]RRK10664.1 GNAT family N-acetyltransferase [Lactiplantibacillus garii]
MTMYVRLATNADLTTMMQVIDEGKRALAADQIPQWQDGYPQASDLQQDINAHNAWLLIVDGQVAGTATLLTHPDPNYAHIYDGTWDPTAGEHYTSIHRIAIASGYHGQHLADFYFSNLMTLSYQLGFHQIRIDTHAKNTRMQHVITKAGFTYRGVVYMDGDSTDQRNAYQITL